MAQVTVKVGGREFDVACHDGEESYLRGAAALLDAEATTLVGQMGRMSEQTMLLLAGLMLADKNATQEGRLRRAEEKLAAREARIAELENGPAHGTRRVEAPAVPPHLVSGLAEMTARAEALADRIDAAGPGEDAA